MKTLLTNGDLFTGEQTLTNQALLLENGIITGFFPDDACVEADCYIDLQGQLLSSGFIDIEVHGGNDMHCNDVQCIEDIQHIANTHRHFGTTSMLPTFSTDATHKMQYATTLIDKAIQSPLANIIGIHLEGPFINAKQRGAHKQTFIETWNDEQLTQIPQLTRGKTLLTLAPECVPNAAIAELTQRGMLINAGHTAATYRQTQQALKHGLRGFTHLFNAMSAIKDTDSGVVGAALESEDSWCTIIVDGHHVHPATLKVALAAKPRGKVLLVSDAIPSVGSNKTEFTMYGGKKAYLKDGVCVLEDGSLIGSHLDMASAVRNAVTLLDLPLEEALRMATLYPAQFLQLNHQIGRIEVGYQANLVLLNKHLQVTRTWLNGDMEVY